MATNWVTLTGKDIAQVLNWNSVLKANQNLAEGTNADIPPDQTDITLANRRDQIVQNVISEVRSAIQQADRYPISVTPNTVPPGSENHVLSIAAWRLLNSTPNLNMAILTEKGVSTPFAQFYRDGQAWLSELAKGASIVNPTDPAGVDYLTAVSDSNPAVSGIYWGDLQGDDADYENEYRLDAAGNRIPLPADDMRSY
jgi:hypothetical protein